MTLFRHLSIKARLYGLVAMGSIGIAAVLALVAYLSSEYLVNGPLYDRLMSRQTVLSEIEPTTLYLVDTYGTAQQLLFATDAAERQMLLAELREQGTMFHSRKSYWEKELFEGPVRSALESDVYPTGEEFLRLLDSEFLPAVNGSDRAGAQQLFTSRVVPAFAAHRKAVEETVKVGEARSRAEEEEAARRVRAGMTMMYGLSAATLIAVALAGWYLSRGIVRSTDVLNRRVSEMASGASDLTARVTVDKEDELGTLAQSINGMIAKIQAVITKVRESSLQVLATASEIAATSRQQEATVHSLNSSTTEIAAAVREISATGKELSGTMDEVNARANQAADLAAAGSQRLAGMEQTMQQLMESTASISAKLAIIREKAENITTVVTTITKVADQTNLLSINAAIEAEKAGEYGRGFLVVAREIRRLADQTAVATLDIGNMVRLMQDAVSAGVMQMDKFSDEVRSSVGRVAEVNDQTSQIIEEVAGLSQRFHAVNEGMRSQAIGAEQINEAMVDIAGGIRTTAQSTEEFNKATDHLRSSIEQLNEEIAAFKV